MKLIRHDFAYKTEKYFAILVASTGGGGGGSTCHAFLYERVAGVPGHHPIHLVGEVKKDPLIYLP